MAKNSALNIEVTPGGTATITFPSATGTLATLAGTEALTNKIITLSAGTASAGTGPLKFTSGTLLSSAEAGVKEYLTNIFYQTGTASNRRVDVGMYFTSNVGDATGANTTAAQAIFQAANDTFTAEANTTYIFNLFLSVTNGTTTCTKALVFGGTATYSKIRYNTIGQFVAINTAGGTQSTAHVDRATSTVVLATGTTAWYIRAQGIIRISTGGTIIPQFAFSADPGGTVLIKSESYFTLIPVGSDTTASQGAWA